MACLASIFGDFVLCFSASVLASEDAVGVGLEFSLNKSRLSHVEAG